MDGPRLTPTMRSRKAIVLAFVTRYLSDHHGVSPSLGEIAAGCSISREYTRELVTALVVEGRLRRIPGRTRGLSLPSAIEEAVRRLRAAGYIVDEDVLAVGGRGGPLPLTFSTLPMLADGAQIAGGDFGGGDGGPGTERGGSDGAAGDRGALPAAGAGG